LIKCVAFADFIKVGNDQLPNENKIDYFHHECAKYIEADFDQVYRVMFQ